MAKNKNKYKGYSAEQVDLTGLGKYFGLARPFDLQDKLTRWVLLGSVLAFCAQAAWKLYQGMDTYDACLSGIGIGFGLLFSFMLGMELDPDRKMGGVLGGVLGVFWSFWMGEPNFMVMLLLIFMLRMLNRSSGDTHKIADNALMLLCAWWLGQEGAWLYPMMLGVAYVIESQLPMGRIYSLFLAAISFGMLWFSGGLSRAPIVLSLQYVILMAAAAILFLPMMRMSVLVEAREDRSGRRMDGKRLRAGNFFFMVSALFISYYQGNAQAVNMAPALFTAAGVGVYLVYDLSQKRHRA